jgi:hypothetical protein
VNESKRWIDMIHEPRELGDWRGFMMGFGE